MQFIKRIGSFSFNIDKVTYMNHMFYHRNSLTKLNISNFDNKKEINTNDMFYECPSLKNYYNLVWKFDGKRLKLWTKFIFFLFLFILILSIYFFKNICGCN